MDMSLIQLNRLIGQVSPPIQPMVKANVNNYTELVLEWNPISIKRHALLYQFITHPKKNNLLLIPDGCINLLFECTDASPQIFLLGVLLKEKIISLKPNTLYFGFKPYSTAPIKNKYLNIIKSLDKKVDFKNYLPESQKLMEAILSLDNIESRSRIFLDYARKYLINYNYIYDLGEHLSLTMCLEKGQRKIYELTENVGYSERYCRKKFKELLGINLTNYNSIMRFQNAMKAFIHKNISLTDIAHNSGYFDQSHFIRDFRKYTSKSPGEFKKKIVN